MFCIHCGTKVADNATVCSNCGMAIEEDIPVKEADIVITSDNNKIDYGKEFDKLKNAAADAGGKALAGAQKMADQISQKVEQKKAELQKQREEEERALMAQKQELEKHKAEQRRKLSEGTAYMSNSELWSWLKQSSKRQMFHTEEVTTLTEAEFMDKISQKLADNDVPATIERKNVQWDRSDVRKTAYYIKPHTSVVNPLTCLVQFNRVGHFTFVEEKTFITPPDLPAIPGSPLPLDAKAKSMFMTLALYGGIATLASLFCFSISGGFGFMVLLVGLGLLGAAAFFYNKNKSIIAHNELCAKQEIAWAEAWNNWQNSIFQHSFQEDINGQLSRVYDAVFECIKQVSAEEFSATKVVEQEESSKLGELEELIARRKDEYR